MANKSINLVLKIHLPNWLLCVNNEVFKLVLQNHGL